MGAREGRSVSHAQQLTKRSRLAPPSRRPVIDSFADAPVATTNTQNGRLVMTASHNTNQFANENKVCSSKIHIMVYSLTLHHFRYSRWWTKHPFTPY